MKQLIFILLLFIFSYDSLAQFSERQELLSISSSDQISLGDLDRDGYVDLLSVPYNQDGSVLWYKNINGNGPLEVQETIASSIYYGSRTHAADIDNDGYIDVTVASNNVGDGPIRIAWYKHIDGQGNFGVEHLISTTDIYPSPYTMIYTIDVDSDGDLDLLAPNFFTTQNKFSIALFINIDGLGNFGPAQRISNDELSTQSVSFADIDLDGDIDIIVSSADLREYLCKVVWFENNGNGIFSSEQFITSVQDFYLVGIPGDIDNDGDMDIITTSRIDSGGSNINYKVSWHENINGQGNFGPQQIISTNVGLPINIHTLDIDQDGDLDVIFSSRSVEGKIVWFENNGFGNFISENIIDSNTPNLRKTFLEDLNGNGPIDIIGYDLENVFWYENQIPLSIKKNSTEIFSVTPIPATNTISIEPKVKIENVIIYNSLGLEIFKSTKQSIINIDNLSSGIYFVHIKDIYGNISMTKIIKE